jgi:ParB-like chromosome segregation protein Spo0J
MKTVVKKLADLKRPEKNCRMHTDKQLVEFRRSVEMFGQIRPIVCDENNVILAGNGLYETLLSMGRTEADCYVIKGLTEKEKKKLMLADNRIFDLGVDDMRVFDEFIAELGDDLDVPGFDDELLRSLTANAGEIDEMMSSYGLITEEKKEQIASAAETYRKEEEARAAQPDEAPEAEVEPEETQPVGRYVICSKCGEKIWL